MREIKVLVTVQVDEQEPSVKVDRDTMQDAAVEAVENAVRNAEDIGFSRTHGRISFRSASSMPCPTKRKIEGVGSNPDSARRSSPITGPLKATLEKIVNATCLDNINHAAGIDLALKKGFHRMVARDVAQEGQAMLDARPSCQFEGLEAGKSYCCEPSYGQPCLVVVGQTTPRSGRLPSASIAGHRGESTGATIPAGLSNSTPICLSSPPSPTRRLSRRPWPPAWKCRPKSAGSIQLCSSQSRSGSQTGHHSAVERVTQSSATAFRKEPINVEDVDGWIDEAHKQIASLPCGADPDGRPEPGHGPRTTTDTSSIMAPTSTSTAGSASWLIWTACSTSNRTHLWLWTKFRK